MPSIVPISDLKNYSEVLRSCDQGATVYLTKNGRGKYVVQSLAEYEKLQATVNPAMTIATMLINLIRMLRLGPEVSLNGSPTVSPTTVALWASLPFPP